MSKLGFLILLLFLSMHLLSFGQEQKEEQEVDNVHSFFERLNWVPVLLNANPNSLFKTIVFNGTAASWAIRGEQDITMYFNGVRLESALNNWRPNDLFGGLQNEFHTNSIDVNGAFSDYGYSTHSNLLFKSSALNDSKNELKMQTAISNSIHNNSFCFHFNNNSILNQWRFSVGIHLQDTPPGFTPNGYKKGFGIAYTMDKDFKNSLNISFSFVWNHMDQSKSTTAVNEVYNLSGQRTYNSSWGWYQNQLYFSNTKQSNAPIISMHIEKQLNVNSTISFNQSMVFGKQTQSSLEWTSTSDPRPDYYRYLPSYLSDTQLGNRLKEWYLQHPAQLQLQFDKLAATNQSSASKQSYYIVNQQNSDLLLLHGAVLFAHSFNHTNNMHIGVEYAFDKIHYYNTIKDLLGGLYYKNYNNWINDDGSVIGYQNDIIHPDRNIKVGEKWGADFALHAFQVRSWMQLNKAWTNIETAIGMGYGMQGLQRVGFNENGLFPNVSKGLSDLLIAPSWDMKWQWLYKISGRLYIRSILSTAWLAPTAASTYISPELHPVVSPYMLTGVHEGVDLTLFYRAPSMQLTASAYVKNKLYESAQKTFYHDAYASFVYGIAGPVNTQYSGIEATVETNIFSSIQLSLVTTVQQNIFLNNPQYQLLNVNDLQELESGILELKKIPATNSPSLVNALSITYRPTYTLQIGSTLLYAQQRPMAVDYFRRSGLVESKLDAVSWSQLKQVQLLPDICILNVFASKSFQMKLPNKTYKWNTSINVHNALNVLIPIFAYEQTRFDYLHFNANKYAPKYLMDQGCTYTLRIQLQIQ